MKKIPKIHLNRLRKLRRLSGEFVSRLEVEVVPFSSEQLRFTGISGSVKYELDEVLVEFWRFVDANSRKVSR